MLEGARWQVDSETAQGCWRPAACRLCQDCMGPKGKRGSGGTSGGNFRTPSQLCPKPLPKLLCHDHLTPQIRSMHKSNAGGLQTEDSFASSRATELAPELSVSGTERRSSFSSARSSQSNKDTLRDAYFMRNHANPMSPQVEPLKSRLNLRQDSMQRNFSPSSLMFRKETLHGDPLSPYRSTPLVPDGYLGLAREVSPEAEGPILPETV